jgi:hypothetical protein
VIPLAGQELAHPAGTVLFNRDRPTFVQFWIGTGSVTSWQL